MIDFWVTLSAVILIVKRFIRERSRSLEARCKRWCKKGR